MDRGQVVMNNKRWVKRVYHRSLVATVAIVFTVAALAVMTMMKQPDPSSLIMGNLFIHYILCAILSFFLTLALLLLLELVTYKVNSVNKRVAEAKK